jgi:hypothetical protein
MNTNLRIINLNIIPDIIKNSKKRITFNDTVYVCYIPTKQEILDEDLKKDLWWSMQEMNDIRSIYNMELQYFMNLYPHNNIRTVQKQLWLVVDFDAIYSSREPTVPNDA